MPRAKAVERVKPDEQALSDAEEIVAWRYLMLLDLSFTPEEALELVAIPHLNWHDAERLVAKGCPKGLVARILE